jgi:hypothetical protein
MARGNPNPKPNLKGRPKGAKTKVTQDIKEMIRLSIDDVGGRAYFARQAEENPVAYMGLVGKILPKEIDARVTGDVILQITSLDEDI